MKVTLSHPKVVKSIAVYLRKCIKNVIFYLAENGEEW